MTVSWNQCTRFATAAQSVLARFKDRETILTHTINRVIARIQKHQSDISAAISDIEIDHCVTGENDVIVRDAQGSLQYTKEGIKARNVATRKFLNEPNVDVEPYFATKLPDDLTIEEIEALTGFVISAEDSKRLMLECEARAEQMPAPSSNGHLAQAAASL
jgi:hypothetical protein